jgi:hypothetical protein
MAGSELRRLSQCWADLQGRETVEAVPEWIVEVPSELVAELAASFEAGPLPDDQGRVPIKKRLVDRANGLRIEIFSNEHPPPHFRVSYGGETNNFAILDCRPLNGRALSEYFRNVQKWHAANKQRLIRVWNETRPTGCPVGEYREERAAQQ